jgi:tripartite-type tricarboxylate transporter receptor subunit TctC
MVRRTGDAVARLCAFVVTLAAGLLLMGLVPPPASAQPSSGKPIRIIIPFGPAGSADVIARILQQPLGQALQQNIIIENRPGAGSNLGTAAVAHAEPDGSTLLITTSSSSQRF